jgi:hypothetical protein
MKKQRLFSLLAAVVLLTAGSLNAQTSNPVKANIPFDFSAGNKSYPAGAYRVNANSQMGALSILGPGSTSGLASAQPVQSNILSGSTKLVFHRYGDRYFLYQIWVAGENRGRELPTTRVENELASNVTLSPVIVMAQK